MKYADTVNALRDAVTQYEHQNGTLSLSVSSQGATNCAYCNNTCFSLCGRACSHSCDSGCTATGARL